MVLAMKNYQQELGIENRHLEQMISMAKKQLSSAKISIEKKEADIILSKKEMWEDSTHSFSNLYSFQGFHELVSFNQFAKPLSDNISEQERLADKIWSLENVIKSPYFARINFKFDDEDTYEKIYIGRTSLTGEKAYDIYIYDWRSPIASVFYRFGTGKAFYEVPGGKVTGEVNLKRQYEINNGNLEYFFDSDIQIVDEFLRKLLSGNTSAKMKTIVETIQKDQDLVIRDMENDLMMVQGAAGSGKTSIGLHRAAYLMYKGLTSKLSSNNIIIISPNTLFEEYISNVLPELGERNVGSVIFEDLFRRILQNTQIQTRNQLLESLISSNDNKRRFIMKSSMEFKASFQFKEILNRFIQDLPRNWIDFNDIYYDGKIIADRQLMKTRILAGDKTTLLGLRLQKLEYSILEIVHELRKSRIKKLEEFIAKNTDHSFDAKEFARLLSIDESTVLISEIRKFTRLNIMKLYKRLFHDKKYFYRLAQGIKLPECIEIIIDETSKNLKRDHLSYEDALALAFLNVKTNGCDVDKNIKQVVIDEAQDYYPLHFEILKDLFPVARYTILGDINQTIEKQEDLSLYDQICKILCKEKSVLITLDKSYRCTNEILEYSTKFISGGSKIKSFSRKGEVPGVYEAFSSSELTNMLVKEIQLCNKTGYRSVGLICKTEKDAIHLYDQLKDRIHIRLVKGDSVEDLNGTFIIPVCMSKGLEFDAVLICNANKKHFNTEDDKNLLYIACTRALHRLNLFYFGEISPLL